MEQGRVGFRLDCRGVKCLRSLGVERISFCCPPIFDWLAPAHEHDGAVSIIQLPRPPALLPHSSPPLTVPKAIGIPGGHQRSSFRRKACWLLGGLLCRSSKGEETMSY
ncbi:hypothetical protein INR49_013013 [Caranx melampygus]|nr:hypothetical protein INR49_013013 [Caranx melampygus]